MATFLTIAVFIAFIALIFTGGYSSNFLDRARETKIWDWLTGIGSAKRLVFYTSHRERFSFSIRWSRSNPDAGFSCFSRF